MKIPCPSCPDGNEWSREGPTGRACRVCHGKAYLGDDDDAPESDYCDCGAVHSGLEDGGRCEACGGII